MPENDCSERPELRAKIDSVEETTRKTSLNEGGLVRPIIAMCHLDWIEVILSLCESHPSWRIPANAPRPSEPSKITLDPVKLNDSIYELHRPDTPSMEILFFHGLQAGDYANAHLSNWESTLEDGSKCIWPRTWLVDKYPDAHILTVSYEGGLRQNAMGMHAIAENLIYDLMQEDIGQTRCPVVLVGHCFGGLVIKQLCVEALIAFNLLRRDHRDRLKLKKFLRNVKGIFYYGTPHHGSPSVDKLARRSDNPLLKYFKTLSTETEWLNFRFQKLRALYPIRIHGLGESHASQKGLFRGVVGVPEPSARGGDVFNMVAADHIGICRPKAENTRTFYGLTDLIDSVLTDLTVVIEFQREPRIREEASSKEEKWALEVAQSQDLLHLLRHAVAAEVNAQINRPIRVTSRETSRSSDSSAELLGSIAVDSKRHVVAADHAEIQKPRSQLSDNLYELHRPPGAPRMQIIFFHGIQPGDYSDAHLSTWKSGDGSCIWIKTWLVEKYPAAQVLSVSYSGAVRTNFQGSFDMEFFAGKLIADLMQHDIGKEPNYCPVILVGHCFGTLVIKHLCLVAAALQSTVVSERQRTKFKNFLASVRGIFNYGAPCHHGLPLMENVADAGLDRPILKYFQALNTETGWLNYQFDQLSRLNPERRIWGLKEMHPEKSGSIPLLVGAPESSARAGEFFKVVPTHHLHICRPMTKMSTNFCALAELLDSIANDSLEEAKQVPELRVLEENGTLDNHSTT